MTWALTLLMIDRVISVVLHLFYKEECATILSVFTNLSMQSQLSINVKPVTFLLQIKKFMIHLQFRFFNVHFLLNNLSTTNTIHCFLNNNSPAERNFDIA